MPTACGEISFGGRAMPAEASVGTAAAAVAKPAPLRKSLRSTSFMARPPCSVRLLPSACSLICLSSMAPAPTDEAAHHANRRRGAGADALALLRRRPAEKQSAASGS